MKNLTFINGSIGGAHCRPPNPLASMFFMFLALSRLCQHNCQGGGATIHSLTVQGAKLSPLH